MLRVMLALLAILVVAASLTSRLHEVRAAGVKNKPQSGKYEDITINTGAGMAKNFRRSTTSGKHISKGQLNIRR
jgi:biopolymer transport protein ExbD